MITREEYMKDPCGTLSIPYWKWTGMEVPEHMRIVHRRNLCSMDGEAGEAYFRLIHDLKKIPDVQVSGYEIETATEADFEMICDVINRSYDDIRMSVQQLQRLTQTPSYDPKLWILARQRCDNTIAGCVIGDLDRVCREGIIEWVQVLPEYRRRGVGMLMVTCLLERMAEKADFATVSGRKDNHTHPEKLYRKCGFAGEDIWYIFRK